MMCFPKRDALFHKVVCEFGGEHGGFEGFRHVGRGDGEGGEHAGEDLDGGGEEVGGGEDGGGAFLHVFVVAGGEGVEGAGEAGEEAVHLPGFAPEELEGIGVLGWVLATLYGGDVMCCLHGWGVKFRGKVWPSSTRRVAGTSTSTYFGCLSLRSVPWRGIQYRG